MSKVRTYVLRLSGERIEYLDRKKSGQDQAKAKAKRLLIPQHITLVLQANQTTKIIFPSEQMRLAKEAYEKSMSDPKMKAQMESMKKVMEDPKMQEQMKKQAAAFQDPAFKAKIEQMKDDPEFKDMFDELKKGGMGALMKFWNDPVLLKKFNDKLGMTVGGGGGGGAGAGVSPSQEPVVEDLLSAAK